MAKTILDSFKGSVHDKSVKVKTETFIEEELTGIRPKSLVELNNPLIYGSATARITLRSTPMLDDMKESIGGQLGAGGLLGRGLESVTGDNVSSLSDVRDVVNKKLGMPQNIIPTRIIGELESGKSIQEILDVKKGKESSKLLKQSAGKPKTMGIQLVGGAISIAKKKLRNKLFGNDISEVSNTVTNFSDFYTDINTYTIGLDEQIKESGNDSTYKVEGADFTINDDFRIDLTSVSPIYGVTRGIIKDVNKENASIFEVVNSPQEHYTTTEPHIKDYSFDTKLGITSGYDKLNTDYVSYTDDAKSTQRLEEMDLIPFWINKVGAKERVHFRTLISGISETVSPSWNGSNFFGNPYSFYTYTGVERSVTFSLQIQCMNQAELSTNWERITQLTQYTYPTIGGGLVTPPIIEFRLGDLYYHKNGYIESLSYTFPDNGNWEIDPDIGLLPKSIDVSISIKFIEQQDAVSGGLYGMERSQEATKLRNVENESLNIDTESRLSAPPVKLNARGITPIEGKSSTDSEIDKLRSGFSDILGGKTVFEAIREAETTMNLTYKQASTWINSLKGAKFVRYTGNNGPVYDVGTAVFQHIKYTDKFVVVYPNGRSRTRYKKQ